MTEWMPGGRSARQALLARLERGEAIGATAENAAVMRAALHDVWALAQRWRAGCNDVGPAAAAEVCDAICGDLPRAMDAPGQVLEIRVDKDRWRSNLPQQPGQAAEEDQPWRSGGEVPGG